MVDSDPILFEARARGYPSPTRWEWVSYGVLALVGLVTVPLLFLSAASMEQVDWEIGFGTLRVTGASSAAGGPAGFEVAGPSPLAFAVLIGFLELWRVAHARTELYELRASGLAVTQGIFRRSTRVYPLAGIGFEVVRKGIRVSQGSQPTRLVLKGLDEVDAEALRAALVQ